MRETSVMEVRFIHRVTHYNFMCIPKGTVPTVVTSFPLFISDEFFHFVILCFAIGALLVCYYYYKGKARLQQKGKLLYSRKCTKPNTYFVLLDWTISLGIGLITFASLETTGIYFGLGKYLQQPVLYQRYGYKGMQSLNYTNLENG